MDKVVHLDKRIEDRKQKERLGQYRGKMETIQKILHCSACHLKCAMCGAQIKSRESSPPSDPAPVGLRFCECCRAEFEEFLSITKHKTEPTLFWHNEDWKAMWSAWLDYRKAMGAFLRSREFKLLMEELDHPS